MCYNILIIFGVTEILRSFRLVLDGKTGKEIPESSRFCFIRCRRNTSGPLNRAGIADIPLLRTLAIRQKSREPSFWEVIELFYFISISKFGSFKNHFATITSLSELYFRITRFIMIKTKTVISMNFGSSTSNWKLWWARLELILSKDVYINSNLNLLTKFTAASDARSFKISSHGTSSKWSRKPSQSARE